MSTRVTVEQMLIGWSRTSNGKNVLAKSPGWPSGTRREWVSALGEFLDPAIDKLVRETGEAPWLLEFRPDQHGSILMAKVYATGSQRAGEFQVHALLDPSHMLGPQHLPELAAAGVLLRGRPDDVTRLETITVEVPAVPVVERVRAVALALQFLHRREPLLLQAATLAEAAELLGELAAALPVSVAAVTPARSVVTDVADVTDLTDMAGITIAVPPWSRGADEVPTLERVEITDGYLDLAERVLAGEVVLPESGIGDWLELALLDPETVTGEELARGLSGSHGRQWFQAAFVLPRTRGLLVDLMRRGDVPAHAWPGPGTVDAELAGLLDEGPRAQAAVARSAPDGLVRSVALQVSDRMVVHSPALVDRLRSLGVAPHNFTLQAGGTQWSEWTDEAWLQWLASGNPLWPGLREGIAAEGFVGHFADLVDRMPRDMLDVAAAQLTRWPVDLVGRLADALVRCRNTSPELLIQTLDRLPPEEVRQLVQRHWPGLGQQLGLPASVVQALRPHRGWFGRG